MDQSHFLLDNFLPEHFGAPGQSIELIVAQKIKDTHVDMQHIVIFDHAFPLASYLNSQDVEVKITNKHRVHQFDHGEDKLVGDLRFGLTEFTWAATRFIAYKVTWAEPALHLRVMYVVLFKDKKDKSETDNVGEELITAAYRWHRNVKEEIYVFSDGCWSKDAKLWKAIQIAQWDSLVLDDECQV